MLHRDDYTSAIESAMRRRAVAIKVRADAREKLEKFQEIVTWLNNVKLAEFPEMVFIDSPKYSVRFYGGKLYPIDDWLDFGEVKKLLELCADARIVIKKAETRLAELGTPI